jgi:P4 family phage/plasmid primase-like protien
LIVDPECPAPFADGAELNSQGAVKPLESIIRDIQVKNEDPPIPGVLDELATAEGSSGQAPDLSSDVSDQLGAPRVSWFTTAKDAAPSGRESITIDELWTLVRSDLWKDPIEKIRGYSHSIDLLVARMADFPETSEIDLTLLKAFKDGRSCLKKQLPCVTLSGLIAHGGRAKAGLEGRFKHIGFLQLDIDGKDHPGMSVAQMREILESDPHIEKVMLSPSGDGVKALCRIGPVETREGPDADPTLPTHKDAFACAQKYYAEKGLKIDPTCSDPARLCFVSHDPHAWERDGPAEVLPVTIGSAAGGKKASANTDSNILVDTNSSLPPDPQWQAKGIDLDDLREMLAAIGPDDGPDPFMAGYKDWLKIINAAYDGFGADAISVLDQWRPGSQSGELLNKSKPGQRLRNVTFSSLIFLAKKRGWKNPHEARRGGDRRSGTAVRPTKSSTKRVDLTVQPLNDVGSAERLIALHGDELRYVINVGWLVCRGERWHAADAKSGVIRAFIRTMKETAKQAAEMVGADAAKALSMYAFGRRNRRQIFDGIELAKSLKGVAIPISDLDSDPMLLGTVGGVVDLRTGNANDPDRRLFITKSAGCSFDAAAQCPRWLEFIQTVTDGDGDLATYLQTVVGYILTGDVSEQCLFVLHGNGANGKSVFLETVKALLGDYGQTAPESLLAANKNNAATNDIARLCGVRAAITGELDEGMFFAESRLKHLTGKDSIVARFLHQEFIEFPPTHKLLLGGNHRPTVRGTDHGVWRRIKLIPFNAVIPLEKVDKQLDRKLLEELPGILNWAIAGCLQWQKSGLVEPACVKQAIGEYKAEQDAVGRFLEDRTEPNETSRVSRTDLYECYRYWAADEGIQTKFVLTATKFNRRVEEHGCKWGKSNGKTLWRGFRLRATT